MNKVARIYTAAAQMDASKVRIIVFIASLVMFVIAAGAPEAGPGIVH